MVLTLAYQMSEFYDEDGVKTPGSYVLVDESIFDKFVSCFLSSNVNLTNTSSRKEVQLNCSDGSLCASIWGDMPDDMRSSLECNLLNAFRVEGGESLTETDSSSTPGGHKFPAIHFSYYARHGTRVRRNSCSLSI
jgi:hypothetical protein